MNCSKVIAKNLICLVEVSFSIYLKNMYTAVAPSGCSPCTECFLGPDIKRFCLTFWYRIFFDYVNRVNLHKTEWAITCISQFISLLNEPNKNLL